MPGWFNNPPVAEYTDLDEAQKCLVLRRYTDCSECACTGHEDRGNEDTKGLCICNHIHKLPEDSLEFVRCLKVAVRIEQLLGDKGKLDEVGYTDADIESLRLQLKCNGSNVPLNVQKRKSEDLEKCEPPSKRVKISLGNLYNKLSPHYKPPVIKASVLEEQEGIIQFRVVNNDNSPMNMIILTGLKNIFQKQLPKMPREYIARLIYDRNHLSMAIVRGVDTGKIEVIGGITYRPFNHRKFAEIVFCAIASNEQVKGYGAHLMNHLKDYVKASSPIVHFLTYADNYAIGYFKKQGFTKDISLDRQVWVGYIKDYEGGTIMQCTMLQRIKYLDSAEIMAKQKATILWKIAETSTDDVVYPGIEAFRQGIELEAEQIPGLRETGWTREMDELARRPKRPGHYPILQNLLTELQNHPSSWPFVQPVNRDEVPDYYEVIKEPMDLTQMEFKLENDQYDSVEAFIYDCKLIFSNCRSYNTDTTTYYKNACKLEKALSEIIVEKNPEYSQYL